MGKRLTRLSERDIKKLHEIVAPVIDKTTGKQARTLSGKLKYRGITDAVSHFGVTRQTISNWLQSNPEKPPQKNYSLVFNELSKMLWDLQKMVNRVQKDFEHCVIIDFMALRRNRELLGESIEDQRTRVFKMISEKRKEETIGEKNLELVDNEINDILAYIRQNNS